MNTNRELNTKSGFALLEVLMAVIILVIFTGITMQAFGTGDRLLGRSQQLEEIARLVKNEAERCKQKGLAMERVEDAQYMATAGKRVYSVTRKVLQDDSVSRIFTVSPVSIIEIRVANNTNPDSTLYLYKMIQQCNNQ